ncbi:hypothetical protein BDF22DRAFT_741124 [Syncephalis plumigaleata]|nr:hypothetical protein BDF22DRAFT_741124 [Syncephalis plumigaleata]
MKLSSDITFTIVVASVVGGIMAAATPPKQRVEPGNIPVRCATIFGRCPDCPDGYHKLKINGATKMCTPDTGKPYLMVHCIVNGISCHTCPDGWHQRRSNDKYKPDELNILKYCERD